METSPDRQRYYPPVRSDPNSTEMFQVQGELLLATKIHIPRPRSSYVDRPSLTAHLQAGLESKLTLLSAPAGSGKTTLLARWLPTCHRPYAWLSLGVEENEPVRFFSYLFASLQTLHPRIGASILPLFQSEPIFSAEQVMTLLSNEIATRNVPPFVLVLDDYHLIQSEVIQTAMTFLLEHLPLQMHLIIATRMDPSFPLTRLRVKGELTELRISDFRLNTNEIQALFQEVASFHLDAEAIAAIESRTEGWVAGVQLALHSVRNANDSQAFIQAFRGNHRLISDYLNEEILFQQSEPIQEFLLTTCILDRLQGTLCSALTGRDDDQMMLEILEKSNLFVVPLDETRTWYRYHQFFAEVLRIRLHELHPERLPSLHERASQWYEHHGFIVEALQHAVSAQQSERVIALLETHGLTCLLTQEIPALMLEWLHIFPDTLIQEVPHLCLLKAFTYTYLNHSETAQLWLHHAQAGLQLSQMDDQDMLLHARITACLALIQFACGEVAQSIASAQKALELLPATEIILRSHMMQYTIHEYRVDGDVNTAIEKLAVNAVVSARMAKNQSISLVSMSNLAWVQIWRGRFHQAAATYREIAHLLALAPPEKLQSGRPHYYICSGFLLREWNQLDLAEERLTQGLAQVKSFPLISGDLITLGYTTMAQLHRARGEFERALEILDELQQFYQQHSFTPALISASSATRAEVELAQGNLTAAIQWLERDAPVIANPPEFPYERSYLASIRVRLAQYRAYPQEVVLSEIHQILNVLLADAEKKARVRSILEIQILCLLTLDLLGKQKEALEVLEQVLRYTEPEYMISLLADEGYPMMQLLERVTTTHPRKQVYLQQLMAACTIRSEKTWDTVTTAPMEFQISLLPQQLPSAGPLSAREMEVLHLISTGASNHDIAIKLTIAVSTAKRHITNIFAKLDVENRMQAVARARELRLL